ncbi:Mu-like prophage major head subunit gpT family protein [Komagataeibacter sp. FNDCF1]|uniref:Mu-like prophage major head subunit gpT family protein n=1 Tax=Komagataeibacter sp. FNDCF1 TaxID=2878681 RepID=UPI001E44917E|nr:Mu-like prophage major head subunit gpT family protein [Komagataeibacter sp. FNDCF1]MCE2564647.1 Mu-like prophage major head subunit gpT family protein [Komagataeibacter sp. FNDCF1]
MMINDANLGTFFTRLNIVFNKALVNAQSHYSDISMIVPSSTGAESYAWLTNFPGLREWVGQRVVTRLGSRRFDIVNKTWESTLSISRNDLEDDQYGIYAPILQNMAYMAASHPDELIFALLAEGLVNRCYDGETFFSTQHPVGVNGAKKPTLVSNVFGAGNCAPWFLLDCSRPMRPVIFLSRRPVEFVSKTDLTAGNVFYNNEYVFGASARYNVGYGLWQLAYACTDPLTPYNYAVVRAAMMSQKSDEGRPLGIKPTHLVTTPGNENAALRLLRSQTIEATTNEWANTAEPIITQFLLGAKNAQASWGNISDFLSPATTYGTGAGTTADGKPPSMATSTPTGS